MRKLKIIENEDDNVVIIDDEVIDGFVTDKNCPICEAKQIYYEKYDSYFCPACNKWLEGTCHDPKCDFCKKRPIKPLKNIRDSSGTRTD